MKTILQRLEIDQMKVPERRMNKNDANKQDFFNKVGPNPTWPQPTFQTMTFQFCKKIMSRKIRHLVSDSKNISLRNRGKVFPYKKCDRRTDRRKEGRKDTAVYKRLLALKIWYEILCQSSVSAYRSYLLVVLTTMDNIEQAQNSCSMVSTSTWSPKPRTLMEN